MQQPLPERTSCFKRKLPRYLRSAPNMCRLNMCRCVFVPSLKEKFRGGGDSKHSGCQSSRCPLHIVRHTLPVTHCPSHTIRDTLSITHCPCAVVHRWCAVLFCFFRRCATVGVSQRSALRVGGAVRFGAARCGYSGVMRYGARRCAVRCVVVQCCVLFFVFLAAGEKGMLCAAAEWCRLICRTSVGHGG